MYEENMVSGRVASATECATFRNPDSVQGCGVQAIENGYVITVQGWLNGNYYTKAYYAVDATALGKRIEQIFADQ